MSRTRYLALFTGLAIFLVHAAIAALSPANPIVAVPPLLAGALLIILSTMRTRRDRDRRTTVAIWGFVTGIMATQTCFVSALGLGPAAALAATLFAIACALGTALALKNGSKSPRSLTFGGYYAE